VGIAAESQDMNPSEVDVKKRVARKLTKKRKEGHQVTMEIPEKFKDGDDADEDCTAPKGQNMYMNQSVFGMIAAAGSQVDFNARFEGQSSDDEDAQGEASSRDESAETVKAGTEPGAARAKIDKHRRKFSEHKLLKSLPHLSMKGLKPKSISPKAVSPGAAESPSIEVTPSSSRGRPVMSRMLEAQAEMSSRPSFELSRQNSDIMGTSAELGTSSLAVRLKEIFEFESPEEVIEGQLIQAYTHIPFLIDLQSTHAG
jgi:sterol 3beta-glucosyltransferase